MALTRKALKAMGLTDEQVDSIVEMHVETTDALKEQRDSYKADAEKLAAVQAELDALKAKGDDSYKEKYESEHTAFENFKADIAAKETRSAKEKAVRAYFESKNITGGNLDLAMRGCGSEMAALEMDGENIKDTAALDALLAGAYKPLVSTTETHGSNPASPPNGGQTHYTTADIARMSTAEINKNWDAIKASLQTRGD